MSTGLLIALVVALLAGCGDGGNCFGQSCLPIWTPTPTATAIPSPTASPTPATSAIVYRLTGNSTLFSSPAGGTPTTHILSGTFTVTPARRYVPNEVFAYTVEDVNIQASPPLSIEAGDAPEWGCDHDSGFGCFTAITFEEPKKVYASMALVIGEQLAFLIGAGAPPTGSPPTFTDVLLCGLPFDRNVSCEQILDGVEPGHVLTFSAQPMTAPSN